MPRGRPRVGRVRVNCAYCGNETEKYLATVQASKTGRFFCDEECRKNGGSKPRTVPMKTCELCGKEFLSYDKGRFCSKEHYDEWQGRNKVHLVCEGCGKEFSLSPSQAKHRTGRWCTRGCESESRIKRALDREHNGKPAVIDISGYVRVYEPDHPSAYKGGWVAEHRLVVEQTLGRRLTSDEHVHHINGDKTDNRPENLIALGHSEHSALTGRERIEALSAMQAELTEYRKRFGGLEKHS